MELISGRDLGPLLLKPAGRVYGPEDAVGDELAGHAALYQSDYKIVFNRAPLGDNQWRLFNIVEDPGESHDLAQEMPVRLQQMLSAYKRYVQKTRSYRCRGTSIITGSWWSIHCMPACVRRF